ncbi:MAG TPA: helix-turn-helix domain-containing protein [Acidimicrobiales bacterium]
MAANVAKEETDLVDMAIVWLQGQLPATWTVQRSVRSVASPDPNRPPSQVDAIVEVVGPQGVVTLIVEAKRTFMPKDAEQLFSGLARRIRDLNPGYPILIVAPWLSSRTRDILAMEGANYLDLTGNARIRLEYPTVIINSQGANRDPDPLPRGKARVRGPKAARLIRLLLDVSPPYGVSDIAKFTDLAPGYVSRLLETLDEEALVERSRRGQVESVDFPGLLRRWTETYDVLTSNIASKFVAANGPENALQQITSIGAKAHVAVTGSFAASRIAPVAAPMLLMAYCGDVQAVAQTHSFLPSDRGANVILLEPFDSVVWDGTRTVSLVTYASVSQVAIDCLTGNGRMPSEGEALLSWMIDNESEWRSPSMNDVTRSSI